MGVIWQTETELVTPVVLAREKDGSQRSCRDYKKLKIFSLRDSYPAPRELDECISSLGDAQLLTTFDKNCGN